MPQKVAIQEGIDKCLTRLHNLAVALYRPDLPESQRRLFTESYRLEDAAMASLIIKKGQLNDTSSQ